MTDALLKRMDSFVIALLDEAERPDCADTANGDTQDASEEGPGSRTPRASLETRISLLKVCTQFMQMRAGKKVAEEPEEPAEIDKMVVRLRKGR